MARSAFASASAGSQTSADIGLLVLRLGCAIPLLALHGGPRLQRAFNYFASGEPWGFVAMVEQMGLPYPLVFAVLSTLAESLGALLLAAGVFVRLAAVTIAINMTAAVLSEFAKGDPIELPGLFLSMALTLALTGGGRYALGRLISRRR
jgi:putative oxidoreductase